MAKDGGGVASPTDIKQRWNSYDLLSVVALIEIENEESEAQQLHGLEGKEKVERKKSMKSIGELMEKVRADMLKRLNTITFGGRKKVQKQAKSQREIMREAAKSHNQKLSDK